MNRESRLKIGIATVWLAVLGGLAISAQDKYKRFADSGGWGYAVFDCDAASDRFTPGTTAGTPPQGNDAKCGFACHTRAEARDYVFPEYGKR